MRLLTLLLPLVLISCSNDSIDIEQSVPVSVSQTKPSGFATEVGSVNFPASCSDDAKGLIERGVGLLHNMTYGEADRTFSKAIDIDTSCAMAYWGKGMALIHPLWGDTPSNAQLQEGLGYVTQARQLGNTTNRENDYINTLAAYYENAIGRSEAERLQDFDKAWETVYRNNPDDLEAAAFYALMHLAPARFQPADKNYTTQKETAEIVAKVLEQVPGHPGAHHYTIHAYDYPALAELALEVSHNYGKIAPDVPHALHMPSHIFTRLGMWKESIEMNIRSGQAALEQSKQIQTLLNDYPHAVDYQVYAYLQLGQDKEAEAIRNELFDQNITYTPVNYDSSAYALSAVPARILLEQHKWSEASQLPLHQPEHFPWSEEHAPYDAIVYFARAIGAARNGDLDLAREAISRMEEKQVWINQNRKNSYWQKQIESQLLSSRAWVAFAEGDTDEAESLLTRAAQIEISTTKAGVTPGEVLPAGELLGDLYLELDRHQDAVKSYLSVLEYSPNRFNSLYGVARNAELAGDIPLAKEYYQKIVSATEGTQAGREQVMLANAFISNVEI